MKKIFSLMLLAPFFVACSQNDDINVSNDDPVAENIDIVVSELAAPYEDDAISTRVYSGTTWAWEAPQVPGQYNQGVSDRIGLAFCGGYSGDDVSHSGVYGGKPFATTPHAISYIGCRENGEENTTVKWDATGKVYTGECVAFYPYDLMATAPLGASLKFDISNQTLKNKKDMALAEGCLYLTNGQIGIEDETTMYIDLVPVSSLLQLRLNMGAYKASTIKKVEITNVGTGFTYLPHVDEAFGFSKSGRAAGNSAAELISKGYASDYKNGKITLTGSVSADAEGYLEIYAWYLPTTISPLVQPTVTLYDENGVAYVVDGLNRDMTTYNGGENLTKFNSGLKMGFSSTSPAMSIVKK